jgi:hypothetical protein
MADAGQIMASDIAAFLHGNGPVGPGHGSALDAHGADPA